MTDKNLNKLREDHNFYRNQLERNFELIEEKESRIMDKKLENKNHKDKINFMQEELKNKRNEYMEKIERIQKQKKKEKEEEKNNIVDKNEKEEKFDQLKLNKLVEIYKNTKSYGIVEGVINDYSKLSSELDKIYNEKEKLINADEVSFVYVKFEDSVVPFKVTDEIFTIADLLKESSGYFEILAENTRIHDHELKLINMTLGVKNVLRDLREKLGNIPYLNLIIIKEIEHVNVELKEEEDDGLNKPLNAIETADLLLGIVEVENELLTKIRNIIFYLIFLFIIFVYNLDKSRIQQTNYVNTTFKMRMVERKYYAMNQKGLENTFLNIEGVYDIMNWGFNSFVEMFDFPTWQNITYDDGRIENVLYPQFTRVMDDFIVIGSIRFMHTRLKNYRNGYIYKHKDDDEKGKAYSHLQDFLELSPVDPPITIEGKLDTYYYNETYQVLVPPTDRDIYLIFAFFRYINFYAVSFETLQIEFSAYNYNQDFKVFFSFLIEQNKYGNFATKYKICVLNYFSTIKNLTSMKISSQIIFDFIYVLVIFFYSLFNVINIIKNIRIDWRGFFLKFWNLIRLSTVSLYIICLSMRMFLYYKTYQEMGWIDGNSFEDHSDLCGLYDQIRIYEILMVSFTFVYLLNYLDKNIVGPIFDTLYSSIRNIIVFITSYVFIIIGYGFFCTFVYGTRFLSKLFYNFIFIRNE